jgi:PAB-dependent poly(A)-specific ribonuclease subunit 2
LSGLKPAEFGLYGRNSRGLRRNQAEKTRDMDKVANSGLKAPKFLSEKARESAQSRVTAFDDKTDELSNTGAESSNESKKSEVPVMYRNVEIKYSKFGVDDFDFGYVSPLNDPTANNRLIREASIINPVILVSKSISQTPTPTRFFRSYISPLSYEI